MTLDQFLQTLGKPTEIERSLVIQSWMAATKEVAADPAMDQDRLALVKKINILQVLLNSSKYAACVYCGEEFPFDEQDLISIDNAREALKEHHLNCPNNPLVQKIKELQEIRYVDQRGR